MTRILLAGLLLLAACAPKPGGESYPDYVRDREISLEGGDPSLPGDRPRGDVFAGVAPQGGERELQSTPEDRSSISDEQDFKAVSSRQSIESDRERLARQRAQYVEIAPTALPQRSGSSGTNIVSYALSASNQLGEKVYRRSPIVTRGGFERACAKYPSPDLAQIAFLQRGGPERDALGVDPDGDGFACYWDPTPFRRSVR